MKKIYTTWNDINRYVNTIIHQIYLDNWKPDIIVGVTRGGAIPAVMISNYMKVKMVGLDVSLQEGALIDTYLESNLWLPEDARNGKKILIINDINDSGTTINWIKNDWEIDSFGELLPWESNIRIATLFDNTASKAEIRISYCAEEINNVDNDVWIVFPWENFWKL